MAGAALFAAWPPRHERADAIAGWLVLAGGAATVLLLAHHPLGLEGVQRLQASSVVGADASAPWLAGGAALAAAGIVALCGRRLLLALWDPQTATAHGLCTAGWTAGAALATAAVIALCVQLAGVLTTTGLLVLPGLIARRRLTALRWWPLLAIGIAIAAALVGLVVAWHADLPPGQAVVGVLALGLAVAWAFNQR